MSSAVAHLIIFFGIGLLAEKGYGSKIPTAADIPAAQSLGAAQVDTVWLKGQAVGTFYASGTLIRGQDHDYVLTAAHCVKFVGGAFSPSQLTFGNGTSYLNDPGLTSGAEFIFVSPSFVPGSNQGLDYAFIRLSQRISEPDLVFRIAPTPTHGTGVLFAGYGIPEVMSGESVPDTANVMGFYGSYSPANPVTWFSGNDSASFTGQNDSGIGTDRDSGGSVKVLNARTGRYESLGTMIGGSSASTIFLNYNNSDQAFHDYLANTVRPIPVESRPPSITAVVTPSTVNLSVSSLTPARQYSLMRSNSMSGWQEAHRFTSTSATYSWSEPVAPEGKMFYRLEWIE